MGYLYPDTTTWDCRFGLPINGQGGGLGGLAVSQSALAVPGGRVWARCHVDSLFWHAGSDPERCDADSAKSSSSLKEPGKKHIPEPPVSGCLSIAP